MKSKFSRRNFLKFLGGVSGFLFAEISGLIPKTQLSAVEGGHAQRRVLSMADRQRIRNVAERNVSFRHLQDYLAQRKFEFQPDLIDALQFQGDNYTVNMLMMGFGEPEQPEASLIFMTGTSEGKSLESSFVWVVGEEAYINKDNAIVPFPEGTERMQGVPRLPHQADDTTTSILARPVYAGHCACHNQYSDCYIWNAICASGFACCILSGGLCCPFAAGACATAASKCFVAQQCGPPC